MQADTLDTISPILPADCFQFTFPLYCMASATDVLKKKHKLPDLADWIDEIPFAHWWLGWHKTGIRGKCKVEVAFQESFFPHFRKGDSLEVCIDTRDLKSAQVVTRFCHHFIFLPHFEGSALGIEVTTFRGEDRHELAASSSIQVEASLEKKGYEINFFLPSETLEGYDPSLFDRLGISIRVNRKGGKPQHFITSSAYWNVESQPSLWSSMELV